MTFEEFTRLFSLALKSLFFTKRVSAQMTHGKIYRAACAIDLRLSALNMPDSDSALAELIKGVVFYH